MRIMRESPQQIDMEIMRTEKEKYVNNDPLIDNFDDDMINIATSTKQINTSIPKNITQAFKSDESQQWIKSTLREVDAMISNEVWIVPENIPKNVKIINSIRVYRKKDDIDIEDKDLLYKSRLVILGNCKIIVNSTKIKYPHR